MACGECDGWGTLWVDEDYVRRHLVEQGQLGLVPVGATTALASDVPPPFQRPGYAQALRNTVVPCHACRPAQYELWKDGHYVLGHRCSTCRPPTRNRKAQ